MFDSSRLISFQVGAKSARGAFTATAKPLDANHMQMIKFSSAQDRNFGIVLDDILEMLQKTQQEVREAGPAHFDKFALKIPQETEQAQASAGDFTEIELQAMESLANRLLSLVSRQRDNSKDSHLNPRKETESRWRRKRSVVSAEQSIISPGTPQSSSLGIKKPKIFFNDIRNMDQDAANTLNPPPPYKKAEKSIALLRQFDTVFILDDSEPMSHLVAQGEEDSTSLWAQLVEAVRYIGDVAAQSDNDGVDTLDLGILKHAPGRVNILKGEQVHQLCKVDLPIPIF